MNCDGYLLSSSGEGSKLEDGVGEMILIDGCTLSLFVFGFSAARKDQVLVTALL